jgi:hypothetical protein
MTWLEHHAASEHLAAEAEMAALKGEESRAQALYGEAARLEALALDDLDTSKVRTLGITAISGVSLYYKAMDFRTAEVLAHKWLANPALPPFAVDDLRALLQTLWSEAARVASSVKFAPGEVLISVKGGEVVQGGAPLDLILEKVQTLQALFYRTAEWLRGDPHRVRGRPSAEVQDSYTPWLFQTVSGSYQFAMALQEPTQLALFGRQGPRAEEVSSEFLRIVEASAEAPLDELPKVVPDQAYRSTILKLTRSLAPTGKRFTRLDIRHPTGRPIILVQDTRRVVNEAIKANSPSRTVPGKRGEIRGVLRALYLDKDWIEVSVGDDAIKVWRVGEAIDDVIGPMVNHLVIVQVATTEHGRHRFIDIEREE